MGIEVSVKEKMFDWLGSYEIKTTYNLKGEFILKVFKRGDWHEFIGADMLDAALKAKAEI